MSLLAVMGHPNPVCVPVQNPGPQFLLLSCGVSVARALHIKSLPRFRQLPLKSWLVFTADSSSWAAVYVERQDCVVITATL